MTAEFPVRALLLTILCGMSLFTALPALAQDPAPAPEAVAEEPSAFEQRLAALDGWFADNVVSHLAKVLFFEIGKKPDTFVIREHRTATIEALTAQGYEFSDAGEGLLKVTIPVEEQAALDEKGVNLTVLHAMPIVRSMPLIVIVLFLGGFFFTFRYAFINIRLFWHSIAVVRGKFDDPDDEGEVSQWKALTSALSATVGLGNIAGVAVAIATGGPGAVFWMWFTAIFGMSMKFSSCAFGQLYRHVHPDGRVLGGPMVYLDKGLKEIGLAPLGKVFGILFAILTVFAAFGAGNMFQANQTASIIYDQVFRGAAPELIVRLLIGIGLAVISGIVIIGGIRRIGDITSKIVPGMCVFYCIVCFIILMMNVSQVPATFASIFTSAFSPEAIFGGFLGVLVQGMRRAAFSNEAGLGSAAIAQAAAKTKEPIQSGVVAMLGPFIDTIVVCTMTALTILITNAHVTGEDLEGVQITAKAFEQLGGWVPLVLCLAVFTFAYSTIISWGYYGERAIEYLVGERGILPYRVLYVLVLVIGPVLSLGSILDFADMLLLSMAFPNLIGMALMSGKIKTLVDDYVARLKAGTL